MDGLDGHGNFVTMLTVIDFLFVSQILQYLANLSIDNYNFISIDEINQKRIKNEKKRNAAKRKSTTTKSN